MKKLSFSLFILLALNSCSSKDNSTSNSENGTQDKTEKVNDILKANDFEAKELLVNHYMYFDGKMYTYVKMEHDLSWEETERNTGSYTIEVAENDKSYVKLKTEDNGELMYELVKTSDEESPFRLDGKLTYFSNPKE